MNSAAPRLPKMILAAAILFHGKSSHRPWMTRRSDRRTAMRIFEFLLSAALILFGGINATLAQNADNGRGCQERWCSGCHAIGSAADKFHGVPSFAAIAAKETINADMIA